MTLQCHLCSLWRAGGVAMVNLEPSTEGFHDAPPRPAHICDDFGTGVEIPDAHAEGADVARGDTTGGRLSMEHPECVAPSRRWDALAPRALSIKQPVREQTAEHQQACALTARSTLVLNSTLFGICASRRRAGSLAHSSGR